MPVKSKIKRKITIDYSDSNMGVSEINGYVELHIHELDGSQTIVIRTEPRKSVKDFMQSEMVETTEEKNNNEH